MSSSSSSSINLSTCNMCDLPPTLTLYESNDVLHRLLELLPVSYLHPNREQHRIPEELIVTIIRTARHIIMTEPHVVHVAPPVIICGDIHGQYYDLVNVFCRRPPHGGDFGRFLNKGLGSTTGMKRPRSESDLTTSGAGELTSLSSSGAPSPSSMQHRYLFLGDYVDRGPCGIEVVITLLALKIISPENMFLLRGNHEDEQLASTYGFFDECKRRYGIRLFKVFCDMFRCLPIAAVVGNGIFCVHGGISPELTHVDTLPDPRPCRVPDHGVVCDLLWADPETHFPYGSDGMFMPSPRGASYVFSEAALTKFLEANDYDLVVRAHQVVSEGYRFFPPGKTSRKLITIFMATNYCGEFDNCGAALEVKEDMTCWVLRVDPPSEQQQVLLRSARTGQLSAR